MKLEGEQTIRHTNPELQKIEVRRGHYVPWSQTTKN